MKLPLFLILVLSYTFTLGIKPIKKEVDNVQYHIAKAAALKNKNEIPTALKHLYSALEYNQTDPNIFYLFAKCYKELDIQDSVSFYGKRALIAYENGHYLKVSPYYLYHDFGVSCLLDGNYDLALYSFNEALRHKITPIALYNRGNCKLYLENYRGACNDWYVAKVNGIKIANKLLNTWCKDCDFSNKSTQFKTDTSTYIDFYPPNEDTLKIALYYNQDWYLSNDRTLHVREAYWVKSKQYFDGPFSDYIVTNNIAKGNYTQGKLNGNYITFYQSGDLRSEGQYKEGLPDGQWSFYYPENKKRITIEIEGNNYEVTSCFSSDGKPTLENGNGYWSFDVVNSFNVGVILEGKYKKGLRHGNWIMTIRPGNAQVMEKYKNGKLIKRNLSTPVLEKYNITEIDVAKFMEYRLDVINQFGLESTETKDKYSFMHFAD